MFNALSVCLDTGEINYTHHLDLAEVDQHEGKFRNNEGVDISLHDAIDMVRFAVKQGAMLIYSWYHDGDYTMHAKLSDDDVVHLYDAQFSHTNAYSG